MINKIDAIRNQVFVSKPSFKSHNEDKHIDNIDFPQDDNGIQAITNYGKAMVSIPKKIDIQPLPLITDSPKVSDDIKGERIYTSDGKLYSIVDEDESTKTIYMMSKKDDSLIDEITVTNKETEQVLKKQINFLEDDKLDFAIIKEFSPTSGKIIKSSSYDNGVLSLTSNYSKNNKNGLDESISYNPDKKEYTIWQDSPNGNIENFASLTKDLKHVTVEKTLKSKNKSISTVANFYNGALISVEQNKKMVIPSLVGKEPLKDKDLIPAKKYNLDIITPDFEGEKTFYSNGAVESIRTIDGTAFFTPEGKVSKIFSPKIDITYYGKNQQQIKEFLGENTFRTTTYDEDEIEIEYSDSKNFKNLTLTSKLKPLAYYEGYFEEDDDREYTLTYHYDSQGFLESAYND